MAPRYGRDCIDSLVPALLDDTAALPQWMPAPVAGAEQVVLLVLDGLGWEQLGERPHLAPTIAAMDGEAITTVVPSTTATALTSLTTGLAPARHGIVGYRLRVGAADVLNVLRWRTAGGDARDTIPPRSFQPLEAFGGAAPPVITRAEFDGSGFTLAHLSGGRFHGWRMPSTLVASVRRLLDEGERFVYAYYDGVDKVAHEFGLGDHYDVELSFTDTLVERLLGVLPRGAALVITSDHGQVDVGDQVVPIADEAMACTTLLSGEGRFRWLHARPGQAQRLAAVARRAHEGDAWVCTREEAVAAGWFGGELSPEAVARVGDVVLAARGPVAFADPADTGPVRLRSRHGSLTPAEMFVPLLGARA